MIHSPQIVRRRLDALRLLPHNLELRTCPCDCVREGRQGPLEQPREGLSGGLAILLLLPRQLAGGMSTLAVPLAELHQDPAIRAREAEHNDGHDTLDLAIPIYHEATLPLANF